MLPRGYSIEAQVAVANGTKTNSVVSSTTAIRPEIVQATLGTTGTPADNALAWDLQRFTAAGTTTAYTPQALDPGDPAATMVAGVNATVEPTYTANKIMLHLGLNQRASLIWNAQPGYAIKMPATASNGIGVLPTHASYTGNADVTLIVGE